MISFVRYRIALPDKEIVLVGTAHVLAESVELVRQTILAEKPSIVCVELDANRYRALLSEYRRPHFTDLIRAGIRVALLGALIGYFQDKVGKATGVLPGTEMLEAVRSAREVGATVSFIDQDIMLTLNRLVSEIPFREKVNIVKEIFLGMNVTSIDLPDEEFVNLLVEEFRRISPTSHRILIAERDRLMAEMIKPLVGHIVVVVGAGHVSGIRKILEGKDEQS